MFSKGKSSIMSNSRMMKNGFKSTSPFIRRPVGVGDQSTKAKKLKFYREARAKDLSSSTEKL